MVKGESKYILEEFVPKVRSKFDASLSRMTKVGEKTSFLKRTYQRLEDGILITPGHYIENMLEVFEGYGVVRAQKVPCDGSIQVEDVSLELDVNESTIYRSLVGMAIYLSQERLDTSFTVKKLASKMSKPTIAAMSRLKKLLGYLKQTMGYSMKLQVPEHGRGSRCSSSCGYALESHSDSDWAGNKTHRRSTSAAVHLVNGCTVFATSKSQKVVSLPSAEAELHALVSAVADGVYIRGSLEFLCGRAVEHYALVDNTAAKQIANKKGVGKIRHLAGKVLWIQGYTSSGKVKVIRIPTNLNLSDIGTKPLSMARTKALLYCIGMVEDDTAVGEAEYDEMVTKYEAGQKIKAMAKTLVKILAVSSLEGAYGHKLTEDEKCYEIEGDEVTENDFVAGASWTMSWSLAFLVLAISAVFFLSFLLWRAWKKVNEEVSRMRCQYEALRGEAEEFRTRMAEIEVEKEDLRILSQSLRFRIVTAERYASSLWEALVMIGGFRGREEEDLPNEEKEELLTREEENRLDWEAGSSRKRRELIERSSPKRFDRRSPNRHDTPRSSRGVWAGENVVNEEGEDEEEEESEHQAVATMDIDDDDVRYGAPATEDEPEPHEPDSEMEGVGASEFGLQDQARRMQRLLEWHQNLLDVTQSRGEFDDVERIERNIEHIEGLMMHLPQP